MRSVDVANDNGVVSENETGPGTACDGLPSPSPHQAVGGPGMAGPHSTHPAPSVPNWAEVEARLRAAWNLCRCRDSVGEQVASDGVRRLLDIAVGFLPESS